MQNDEGHALLAERQQESENIIARMFDGEITLVAAIRCGAHCGTVLHLYPGVELKGEPMTVALAKEYAERQGWCRRVRSGERVWLCPECVGEKKRNG